MKIRRTLALLFLMLIVALSWITNFGWYRLFGTLILIPFIHAIFVFAISVVGINYLDFKKIRAYNFLFLITYLMSNIFLSDVNEEDVLMFFGLIHNGVLCNIGNVIAIISLIAHLGLSILQIIEIRRVDKSREKT
ncbi:MAG: hypothetical protein IJW15_04740 [Clostridia bacterium]|nr:hypothetical protein [Clostridia bacterium]